MSVALSEDGRFAAAATTYGVKLWEVEGPRYRGIIAGRDMALYQIVTTPDGCRMLLGIGEWVHAREISVS